MAIEIAGIARQLKKAAAGAMSTCPHSIQGERGMAIQGGQKK